MILCPIARAENLRKLIQKQKIVINEIALLLLDIRKLNREKHIGRTNISNTGKNMLKQPKITHNKYENKTDIFRYIEDVKKNYLKIKMNYYY